MTTSSTSWKWPLAIAGLLAVNVIAAVTLAIVAHLAPPAILPDYATQYTHGEAR
jgi:hypothetical protein